MEWINEPEKKESIMNMSGMACAIIVCMKHQYKPPSPMCNSGPQYNWGC
ncbi:hypothetical protein HYH85_09470 [Clostridium botulinum]|nr:hypothetical protein [Clostridium botulinum]MBY6796506.1 hypothetical protein [Clostridium botulinum]MBY6864561.1 hypothetical protein [Clostridium botulinum]